MLRNWWFSLLLLVVYLGLFHFWHLTGNFALNAAVGLGVVGLMSVVIALAIAQGYFRNPTDAVAHAVVLVDLVLEAMFVYSHEHYGFYLCAIAFALVIGGYRYWVGRQAEQPRRRYAPAMA